MMRKGGGGNRGPTGDADAERGLLQRHWHGQPGHDHHFRRRRGRGTTISPSGSTIRPWCSRCRRPHGTWPGGSRGSLDAGDRRGGLANRGGLGRCWCASPMDISMSAPPPCSCCSPCRAGSCCVKLRPARLWRRRPPDPWRWAISAGSTRSSTAACGWGSWSIWPMSRRADFTELKTVLEATQGQPVGPPEEAGGGGLCRHRQELQEQQAPDPRALTPSGRKAFARLS